MISTDVTSVNLLLICTVGMAVINVISGYKKGMVRAVISLVSLVILCVVAVLLANGISSYHDGNFFHVALVVILLAVLGLAHHLLSVVFFSAKLVVRLPVIHFADKLLGIVFGLVETVLILWTLYTFVMMMDLGEIGDMILTWTGGSPLLTWLYEHNYLAYGIERLLEEFQFIPLTDFFHIFENGIDK